MDQRKELLNGVKNAPDLGECIWVGKPLLLPFILGDRLLFRSTIILGYLIIFANSAWIIKVSLSLFYLHAFINSVLAYNRRRYFITPKNLIVQLGRKFYYFPTEELIGSEFKAKRGLYNKLFDCKTVQYGRYYGNSEGDNNIWSDKAKFRCIKDYEFVIEFIKTHTSK